MALRVVLVVTKKSFFNNKDVSLFYFLKYPSITYAFFSYDIRYYLQKTYFPE